MLSKERHQTATGPNTDLSVNVGGMDAAIEVAELKIPLPVREDGSA
jgi:hypothetical protein